MAKSLELIARHSMLTDALEDWGDRVFTDGRVRKALGQLAAQPTAKFLQELNQLLGKPEISTAKLRESLARVMDAKSLEAPKSSDVVAPVHKPKPPIGSPPGGGKEWSLDHHLAGKPAAIVDNFEQLDQFGRELGADVTRRIRKQYIGFFAGKKSFFTIEVQRQRLLLYLNLDPNTCSRGMRARCETSRTSGTLEWAALSTPSDRRADLDGARALIQTAYTTTSA